MSEAIVMQCIVPVAPKGMGRPRFGAGRAYTPTASRKYVETLRAAFEVQHGDRPPSDLPLKVSIVAFMPLPQRARGRRHHTQRPDVDNIAKAVLDALMPDKKQWRGVISDDAQIIRLVCEKRWAEHGSVHVTIREIHDDGTD